MVTVVIPLYNAETTIEQALDSVRTQTAVHLISRVIVIDDGSCDGSAEKVKAYMSAYQNFPLELICQRNGGAAAARNTGLREVRTRYVAFLDADDIWLPDKLEKQFQVLSEHPYIRFLGTNWQDTPLRIGTKKITSLYNGSIQDLCIKNFPVTPSILMEASLRDEVGYFDPNRRFAEDINYFQKIAVLGNYFFMPEKLVEIDIGKKYFAQSGLSSHLKQMHQGTVENLNELRKNKNISYSFWVLMRLFYELKYWRRIVRRFIKGRIERNRG